MITGNTYRDLTNLINLYNESGKIILTGNKDIDYQILNHLEVQDLSTLCRTNQYTRSLCGNNTFWVQKFKDENLPLYDENLSVNEWLDIYKKTKLSQKYAKYTLKVYDIQYQDVKPKIVIRIDSIPTFNLILNNHISFFDYHKKIMKIEILPDTKHVAFYDMRNHFETYILTKEEIITILTFVNVYINVDYIVCEGVPLLIDDNYIQQFDPLYTSIIFERYGILKSIVYNE